MFDQTIYIPILKTKAGEAWALDHLEFKVKPRITPVFEIHPPPKAKDKPPKPMDEHIREVCAAIKKFWGRNPFFLDTEWVKAKLGTASVLTTALNACRDERLQAIPVVKIDYDEAALDVVKFAAKVDNRGYMLRSETC